MQQDHLIDFENINIKKKQKRWARVYLISGYLALILSVTFPLFVYLDYIKDIVIQIPILNAT